MPQANSCSNARLSRWSRYDHVSSSDYPVRQSHTRRHTPHQSPLVNITISYPSRIGYEKGKYGFVFARRGITLESCSSYFLPRLVGHSNASYLVSTGGVFPPTSKHFGDLFNEILPDPTQVLPRALELATDIAENVSPASSYLNRALMWRDTGSAEAAHLIESKVINHMFGSE
jgi:Enoyl-CoA hydratase/carnithine racemase